MYLLLLLFLGWASSPSTPNNPQRNSTSNKDKLGNKRQHLTLIRQGRRTHEDESERTPSHNRKQSIRRINRRRPRDPDHHRILWRIWRWQVHPLPPASDQCPTTS